MHEYLTKKLKTEKTFRSCLIALTAFWIFIVIIAVRNKDMYQYMINLAIVLIFMTVLYFKKFYRLMLSVKRIIKSGSESITADIDFEKTAMRKSGIYCGSNAMYSKKYDIIAAYDDIISVSCKPKGKTAAFTLHFCDGGKLTFRADKDEFIKHLDEIKAEKPHIVVNIL